MKLGIGTYSFGGLESFLGLGMTLEEKFKKIHEMGFDAVEILAGDLNKNSTEDLLRWAKENELTITSVHAEPTEENILKMAALGGGAVIWPATDFCNKEEAEEVAAILQKAAEFAAPLGVKIAYHNHSKEFFMDEGKSLLEHLLDAGDAFYSQLDCGWAQNGGMYPPYFIRKYKNRILTIHVKENSKVVGPGPRPASRHTKVERPNPFASLEGKSLEEKKAFLEAYQKRIEGGKAKSSSSFDVQCKMGVPESNMNWMDIKEALDEQDFEAFWIIEREAFYDEHDKCIQEDCDYIRANIK